MHRIAIRQWTTDAVSGPELTLRSVGEPFFDPIGKRLGIWDGDAIVWFPAVNGGAVRVPGDKIFGGLKSGGGVSPVVLDWTDDDALVIRDTATGVEIARFSTSAAVFNNASSLASGRGGANNLIVNAGLESLRAFVASSVTMPTNSGLSLSRRLLAPNWWSWLGAASTGSLSAVVNSVVGSPVGLPTNVPRFMRVLFNGNPSNAGLSVAFYGAQSLRGRTVNASVYLKGPVGLSTKLRVRSDGNSVLNTLNVVATGDWQRVSMTVPVPSTPGAANVLTFDLLYMNGLLETQSTTQWDVAAPQITDSITAMLFESRPLALEQARLGTLYQEGSLYMPLGADNPMAFHNLPNFASTPGGMAARPIIVDMFNASGQAITSTGNSQAASKHGFMWSEPAGLTLPALIHFHAYAVPGNLA